MTVLPWDVPIKARWLRANDLTTLAYEPPNLTLHVIEEDTQQVWSLAFPSVNGFHVTSEECSASILAVLPSDGGFFEVIESPWVKELGYGGRHFVIACYDNIVEIVGSECRFEKVP
jgi:hypothetical protein